MVTYYLKNKFSLLVLRKHGSFSKLGQEIFAEMETVMKMTDSIFAQMNIPKEIILTAQQAQKEHFKKVNFNYPQLKY